MSKTWEKVAMMSAYAGLAGQALAAIAPVVGDPAKGGTAGTLADISAVAGKLSLAGMSAATIGAFGDQSSAQRQAALAGAAPVVSALGAQTIISQEQANQIRLEQQKSLVADENARLEQQKANERLAAGGGSGGFGDLVALPFKLIGSLLDAIFGRPATPAAKVPEIL